MAHVRQSRPDSGLGLQVEVVENTQGVRSSLGRGQDIFSLRAVSLD